MMTTATLFISALLATATTSDVADSVTSGSIPFENIEDIEAIDDIQDIEEIAFPVTYGHHDVIHRLTEDDFKQAAEELEVDVPTIKAIICIEAGPDHQGFHAPGEPIINFDLTMFRRAASRRGINLNKYKKSHHIVFNRADTRKYGSYQAAQHERLKSAMSIDSIAAIDGTFWGMFQIGGFNWKKCGAASRGEFIELMSRSEHDQLELFVNFIKTNRMDKYLRKKDWTGFARAYNGPSYARRGYHKRLAKAYKKYKTKSTR